MNDDIFKAALAGLLHDIGKFAQRAGKGLSIQWQDGETRDEFKYQHALYTDQVVAEIVPDPWRAAVQAAAGRHHRPQEHLDRVVSLADRLSAGERADETGRHPRQLLSIFCDIDLADEQDRPIPTPQDQYLPLKELRIQKDTIFPVETMDDSHDTYEALWEAFVVEARNLKEAHREQEADPLTYLNSLLKLMQRYCWAIPSAYYQARPDVGLYDHSRMTAALAACLVGQAEEKVSALLKQKSAQPVALLVGGDISGVQKFIYTITSRGAAGGLRGRSMYLQLLTEVVARYVLDALDLPLTNLVYAGGGHFYLLAPPGSQEKLDKEVQPYVSRVLLHHHGGDLHLALAATTLPADGFRGPALSGHWRELTQQLEEAKLRRFSELEDKTLQAFFTPQEHGGGEETFCAVCQREHRQTQEVDEVFKCPACLGFEELGKALRHARCLALDQRPPAEPVKAQGAGRWEQVLAHFGYEAAFYDSLEEVPPVRASIIRRSLLALDNEVLDGLQPGPRQSVGRHLLVNVTPVLTGPERDDLTAKGLEGLPPPGSVKPFDVMAHQARGIKRLGILRMDVDNLGQILSRGLGERSTLSRVAALSFSLSLFFEGWVEQITRDIDAAVPEKDLVYSIYSGGDDLFFVGAWSLMPGLAARINHDLGKYTGHHPGIHVSGGIVLIPGKYPLYQAAEDAHQAERAAKTEPYNGRRKNALNFLDKTIPWEKFSEVQEKQETLVGLVVPEHNRKKAVPRSLVQRLTQLYLMYEQVRQAQAEAGEAESRAYWGRGQWYAAYSLTRLAKQHKHAQDNIQELRDDLKLDDFTQIEWLGPAARWVELLTR